MNNYHAFSIGFNWWYVLLFLEVILMFAFGASNVKLNKKTYKIMRRDKKGVVANFFAICLDAILIIAVLTESSAGILQLIDNNLSANDNPAWALILFAFSIAAFALVMYHVLFGATLFGKKLKTYYCKELRKGR